MQGSALRTYLFCHFTEALRLPVNDQDYALLEGLRSDAATDGWSCLKVVRQLVKLSTKVSARRAGRA